MRRWWSRHPLAKARSLSIVLRFQPFPRMWDRVRFAADDRHGAVLRLGPQHIRLSDVVSVEHTDHAERDFQGVLVMGCVFTMAAALLMIGVYEAGMRERFLLGAFIFFVLGLISLYEAITASTFRFVRLRIVTVGGETLFTTADAADAAALEQVLACRRA